jgi:hypothetical protein
VGGHHHLARQEAGPMLSDAKGTNEIVEIS